MTSAAEVRYVANRSGPVKLAALPPPRPKAAPAAPPETNMATTTPTRTFRTKAERKALLAELTDNGGTKTVAQLAKDAGVNINTIYTWRKAAAKGGKKRAAKKKRSAVRVAAEAFAGSNGHALAPVATPTIELRGLRDWVRAEVAAELKRRFGS